jgi:hypothetical protein
MALLSDFRHQLDEEACVRKILQDFLLVPGIEADII